MFVFPENMNKIARCHQENQGYPKHVYFFYLAPLWAYSAGDKLMVVFLFFAENRNRYFMQIVSIGGNVHEMLKPVFWKIC